MPAHPILSLKAALRTRLLAEPALAGLAVHDAPPRGIEPPYLVLGDAAAQDNGTSDAGGAILDLDLVAFTRERGTAEALALAGAVEAALSGALPVLADHRLVALERRETLTRHDAAASLTRAVLRYRAYTEPL